MADFNIFDHISRAGLGQQKSTPTNDGTNEKSTVDALLENSGKATDIGAKITGIPINITELGQHGLQKAIGGDTEGLTGKMIMPSFLPDAQGGFLARLLHDIFVKNREVTDHTGGTGGDATGGGSDMMSGGGGFADFNMQSANFGDFAAPSNSYDWSDISLASLGNLPRPALPDMGPGQGADIGIA